MINLKFKELNNEENDNLNKYIKILLQENKTQNLISRKIKIKDLIRLVYESILLNRYVTGEIIVDAGSGNGLLGIILSIINKEKRIVLVELRKKRVEFLKKVVGVLKTNNTNVVFGKIDNAFNINEKGFVSVVSRGFPFNEKLFDLLKNGMANEIVIITSKNKIKKLEKKLKNSKKNVYNIKFRDNLKILKVEKVSRET